MDTEAKNTIAIILSLLFWIQITIIVILGIKLILVNRQAQESHEKAVTPAMIKGKI